MAVSCFACGCVDVAVLICLSFADMLESFDHCVNTFDDVLSECLLRLATE